MDVEFEAQLREADIEKLVARRIIDGKTYNTGTSQLIAARVWDDLNNALDGAAQLYMTRDGRFFEVRRVTRSWRNRDTGRMEKKETMDVTPVDDDHAPTWAEFNQADIIRDVFSLLDEDAPATEETLLLRMSASDKALFRRHAEEQGTSMNDSVLRLAKIGFLHSKSKTAAT